MEGTGFGLSWEHSSVRRWHLYLDNGMRSEVLMMDLLVDVGRGSWRGSGAVKVDVEGCWRGSKERALDLSYERDSMRRSRQTLCRNVEVV